MSCTPPSQLFEPVYTSASCNRYPHCLDYGDQLVAFASCHAVVLYSVQESKVKKLLVKHKGLVNCVRWIEADKTLISASSDKTALVWRRDQSSGTFEPLLTLSGHSSTVSVADCVISQSEGVQTFFSCTSSTDLTLKFWKNDKEVNSLILENFAFDVKIIASESFWGHESAVIAYASGDELVHLVSLTPENELIQLICLRGHQDWVRALDYIFPSSEALLIASGAQDNFVRVWKILKTTDESPQIHEKRFNIKGKCHFIVTLDTVLSGHENWVYGVKWMQPLGSSTVRLLTSSMDKTMIVWEEPEEGERDQVWLEKVRVGEVGGNGLGFLGCCHSSDGSTIAGHSFNGAIHFWHHSQQSDDWEPGVNISGHFEAVTDIVWEPRGEYLLSCSSDEMTRLHYNWKRSCSSSWHEMARPQIHGYEINCIAMIDRLNFVSGADEKVLRVFRATRSFVRSIANLGKAQIIDPKDTADDAGQDLAEGASVPALGLSNRAVNEANGIEDDGDCYFKPVTLIAPPTEEALLQNTLWPEVQKLYGHGFELFAVAVNHKGTVLASGCKASKAEHASLILWDVKDNFNEYQRLASHQLTVTRIAFSPDDRYLLSVSRDRTWALFAISDDQKSYSRVAYSDKKTAIHSRIIWDASWSPDCRFFVTVSRDKQVVIWALNEDENGAEEKDEEKDSCVVFIKARTKSILTLEDSIICVDVCQEMVNDCYLIAFGLENGKVIVYKWSLSSGWQLFVDITDSHHLCVKRVKFRPKVEPTGSGIQLASCGSDRLIQILQMSYLHL